jgi:phosphate transport system substrate-binding protein
MDFIELIGLFVLSGNKMKNKLKISFVIFFLIIIFSGCKFFIRDPYTNTPTSGKIRIAADETFKKIIEPELSVFQSLYNYSEIKSLYVPENELFRQLLADSVNLIVASRYLNQNEIQILKNKKLFPRQVKIAVDGIALIVNPENSIPVISLKQLRQIFTGDITHWNELSRRGKPEEITIVFDNQQSSILRMVVDSICREKPLTKKAYATQFNQDVLNYVAHSPGALGLIGVSWISDRDDSLQLSFLKQVNVVSLSRDPIATSENSYKPFQAYLLQGKYVLTREIIMINTEPRNGLSTGLTSFIASDKGQRIILKAGVLPAVAPTRLVNVRENI